MKEIRDSLHEEIQTEFEYLKEAEFQTEDFKNRVDGVAKLIDRAIEIEKVDADIYEKAKAREMEQELKEKQMVEDKKDRIVKNGIAIAGIVIPTGLTVWGTLKSLKFEEVGTVTTTIGRNFINKLFKK